MAIFLYFKNGLSYISFEHLTTNLCKNVSCFFCEVVIVFSKFIFSWVFAKGNK